MIDCSVPLPLNLSTRTDDIALAVVRLLAAGGMDEVTMRAVARGLGGSVGTLMGHCGSRKQMLHMCAAKFVRWRWDDLDHRLAFRGLAEVLPATDEDMALTRVEMAWREAGRSDEKLAELLQEYDRRLGHALGRAAWPHEDLELDEAARDSLLAVVVGLWDALCRPAGPGMTLEQAQRTLAAAASAFARSSPTIASGSAAE